MIRNERQLRIARTKRDSAFEAAASAEDPVDRQTYQEFADEIDGEIEEYVRIREGQQRLFSLDSVDALAQALIKARIAAGLTQRELAERLQVSEQMVQRDEAGAYENAKLSRLADVSDALDYELHGALIPKGEVDTGFKRFMLIDAFAPGVETTSWFAPPRPHQDLLLRPGESSNIRVWISWPRVSGDPDVRSDSVGVLEQSGA